MATTIVYNRKDFFTFPKDQLLDYIEQQNEQLARFETRFRDVVKAYKGVVKEKEALESSLHALSSSAGPLVSVSNPTGGTPSDSEQELSDSQQSVVGAEQGKQDDVKGQLATLTQALSTVAQEKSKMEQSFQQDKKNLLAQQESLNQQYTTRHEEMDKRINQLQMELEESRSRLTEERRGRREEEEKFGDMLKELQGMVNKERVNKEVLSQELQATSSDLQALRQQLANDRTQEYSETIGTLTEQLKVCREELDNFHGRLNEPSPVLLRLQEELRNIKQEHADELEAERCCVREAERRCQLQSQQAEERLASLEGRLAEMSQVVGDHEGHKDRDQIMIQKLRDRIAQLDSENTALTKAHLETSNRVSSETVSQIAALQEKVSKLRQLIRVATQRVLEQRTLPQNIEDMSVAEYSDMLASEPSRQKYQEELCQLRTEFTTYKQRAQSVLKSKTSREQDSSKDIQEREQRYEELMRVVERLRREGEEEREEHSVKLQGLRKEMRDAADHHRHEILQSEVKHKQKLQDLQSHIQTTRERTKKLLEEKDSEILVLRGELQAVRERSSVASSLESNSLSTGVTMDMTIDTHSSMKSKKSGAVIQELLDQPSPVTGDVQWFLQAQEQQRMNGEMTSLRRKRLDLEDTIRDLMERDERHLEQTSALKMEIRKLERDRSRETENFEYLKNIVLHYMCAESSSRFHLVKPIATILHFSPNEIDAVERRLTRGWFSPSK